MIRLTPRSIMQLVDMLHFTFLHCQNCHCCHRHLRRRRHLRAQPALFLGTTCILVRGDSNLQPSSWSVPPLPLHLVLKTCLAIGYEHNLRWRFKKLALMV